MPAEPSASESSTTSQSSKVTLLVKETAKNGFEGKIEIPSLNLTVEQLKEYIRKVIPHLQPAEMRILVGGRFLKDGTLSSNQVKEGSKLMILRDASQTKKEEIKQEEKKINEVEKMKKAVEEVASRVDGGSGHYEKYHFVLEDQNGRKINLPVEEKKNLVAGMTYHQKAKEFMKAKKYKEAHDLLRESDEAFRKVNSTVLLAVDNYALMQLDLVWAMFHLKDPNLLKEAKQRLDIAEKILETTHGKNLERVKQLKGGFCPEQVLHVRLHLLQMVAAYHSGDFHKAKALVWKVDFEMGGLILKEEDLAALVSMGFSKYEAKIALRATGKNMEQAISYILQKREKQQARREAEKARAQRRRKQIAFGVTKNGELVNMQLLENLRKAFRDKDEDLIVEALKQTNNKEEFAVQFLTDTMKLQFLESQIEQTIWKRPEPLQESVLKLMEMGFTDTECRFALRKTRENVQKAADLLLSGKINPKLAPPPIIEEFNDEDMGDEQPSSAASSSTQATEATPASAEASSSNTTVPVGEQVPVWEWQDGSVWVSYSEQHLNALEAGFITKETAPTMTLDVAGKLYTISFTNMTQLNTASNFERRIRRRLVSPAEKEKLLIKAASQQKLKNASQSKQSTLPKEEEVDDIIHDTVAHTFKDEDDVYDIDLEEESSILSQYKSYVL